MGEILVQKVLPFSPQKKSCLSRYHIDIMGIAPSHVDDPETTTTGESKTNDNNSKNTTIDGIIGVLPSLGEVPGELECAICAEVVLFFPRVFFVSNLRVLLLPCIFTRARRGGGGPVSYTHLTLPTILLV